MPSVKVSELFKLGFEDWYDLYVDFHAYKVGGIQPKTFGRDAPLEDKFQLNHIHLATSQPVMLRWASIDQPFRRTHRVDEPENDYWLIYAYDEYLDEYLMLRLMGPGAHNRKGWGSLLRNIVSEIVEPWSMGRVTYDEPD